MVVRGKLCTQRIRALKVSCVDLTSLRETNGIVKYRLSHVPYFCFIFIDWTYFALGELSLHIIQPHLKFDECFTFLIAFLLQPWKFILTDFDQVGRSWGVRLQPRVLRETVQLKGLYQTVLRPDFCAISVNWLQGLILVFNKWN